MGGLLEVEEKSVVARSGTRRVLVCTPNQRVLFGRSRIAELRKSAVPGPIDLEMLREVRKRRGRIQVLVMRGRSDDGSGSWGLDPALSDEEAAEAFVLLNRSMVPTYRRILGAGIRMFVHTEFGVREADAFRHGAAKVGEELQRTLDGALAARDVAAAAIARVDLWVLRHLTFFFALGLQKVLDEVIPDKLPLFEQREPHVQEMLQAVPEDALR